MIHTGDTLENPGTGEVLVVQQTSEETNGESVSVETIVRPNGLVAAAHVYLYQTERFENTVRLPFPPAVLQRAALAIGAPLGKALAYGARATCPQAAVSQVTLEGGVGTAAN